MGLLTLKTLECVKKQDVFTDKIRVKVNGITVTGDIKIDKNDPPFDLAFDDEYTGTIPITLIEVDKNGGDEHLGTRNVNTDNPGDRTAIFDDDPKSDYRLKYEVS